jgi:hypothetical protein
LWYADYLLEPLRQILPGRSDEKRTGIPAGQGRSEQRENAPQSDWTEYYASLLNYPQTSMTGIEPGGTLSLELKVVIRCRDFRHRRFYGEVLGLPVLGLGVKRAGRAASLV